jgi:hypothetical protein
MALAQSILLHLNHNRRKPMPFRKYSKKQKKLARVAPPRKKITKADFKKLKQRRKKRKITKRKK